MKRLNRVYQRLLKTLHTLFLCSSLHRKSGKLSSLCKIYNLFLKTRLPMECVCCQCVCCQCVCCQCVCVASVCVASVCVASVCVATSVYSLTTN